MRVIKFGIFIDIPAALNHKLIPRMKKVLLFSLGLFFFLNQALVAGEGMWLPFLLKKNIAEMQKMGLKLTAEDLYSVNHSSLKDAIVMLDGGNCTGEIISSQGLLLTNHHCGYGDIQKHSSVDHDYLTDGFWAMSFDEELPNPGKTASFLVRIEDVTDQVLKDVTDEMSADKRGEIIRKAEAEIVEKAIDGTHYNADVKSMYDGNEYYLFVYETFRDVRLVGAPPSSIGKYGGDTDNWMWPRHTGDFSIFRVYADKDGNPADYSEDNVPYQPKHHLPVSLDGVQENDFAMIWGYPGSTDRYRSSYGIDETVEQLDPTQHHLKDIKMKIMKEDMDADDAIRIAYASEYAYLGNFWKKADEEAKALKRLDVAGQKRAIEDEFQKWANADPQRKKIYGNVINDIRDAYKYKSGEKTDVLFWYFVETLTGSKMLFNAFRMQGMQSEIENEWNEEAIERYRARAAELYKDYNMPTDKKIFVAMLEEWYNNMPPKMRPSVIADVVLPKFKGDFNKYADYVYKKSIFASQESVDAFLEKAKAKKLQKDPGLEAVNSVFGIYRQISAKSAPVEEKLAKARRLFIRGLREMNSDKLYYPDANSTMRVTYGIVNDYIPRDAVQYDVMTYLEGVMEKEDPDNEEFIVPEKLKELYNKKDYGRYGIGDKMPVCFLTDHDITGGNSGSPVINANGELIGTAFDGNSEAMSGDIEFDEELQRTIVCDIRYVLFVVDKYAGAQRLIDEMNIVQN